MSDETPDKADPSANDTPIVARTEDQWRDQFRTLFRNKLGSIFEIAKQITLFHEQVNKNPALWPGEVAPLSASELWGSIIRPPPNTKQSTKYLALHCWRGYAR